ncbi:MAG: LPS assembly lipoprotein LptE [Rhodospirillaceae bacterium]
MLVCGLLAGCGFRPLYGEQQGGSIAAQLLSIEIEAGRNREGQMFRNELVRLLYGGGRPSRAVYRLKMELSEGKSSLAVRKSAYATRGNLKMSVNFELYEVSTGKVTFSSTSSSTVSYNVLDAEFSALLAEKNARERALRMLGEEVRVLLGNYFDRLAAGQVDRK